MTITIDEQCFHYCSIDTPSHLEESLQFPVTDLPDDLQELMNSRYISQFEERMLRYLRQRTHQEYELAYTGNSYNADNDLSHPVLFNVFIPVDNDGDWVWASEAYVTTNVHIGGDVRGNYGDATLWEIEGCLGDSGFFDWTLGWHASPIPSDAWWSNDRDLEAINNRISQGYASCPSSDLASLCWNGTEPVWSDRLGSWVCRFADVGFATRIEPTEPCYG